MAVGEDILARLDAEEQASRARVRAVIAEAGKPEILAQYDNDLRRLDLGILAAENAWHSLTEPQRRTLVALEGGGVLVRLNVWGLGYHLPDNVSENKMRRIAGVRTVRSMAERGLIAWDGGATDPEAKAVATERALFVLKHRGAVA